MFLICEMGTDLTNTWNGYINFYFFHEMKALCILRILICILMIFEILFCSQQDAQEFLRYLLQGLHDDVNRVTAKPTPLHSDIDDNLRLGLYI